MPLLLPFIVLNTSNLDKLCRHKGHARELHALTLLLKFARIPLGILYFKPLTVSCFAVDLILFFWQFCDDKADKTRCRFDFLVLNLSKQKRIYQLSDARLISVVFG